MLLITRGLHCSSRDSAERIDGHFTGRVGFGWFVHVGALLAIARVKSLTNRETNSPKSCHITDSTICPRTGVWSPSPES